MFRIILLLLLLLPANVFAYECSREIDNLAKTYDIQIHCSSQNSFPATGDKPQMYMLENATPYLQEFLFFYTKDFISKNIDNIYLLSDLKYDGIKVAGLSNGKDIWIKTQVYYGEYRDFLRVVFHHEFSSNILKAKFINLFKWKNEFSINQNCDYNFYQKNLTDFEFSRQSNQEIYSQGFVYNYGKTNPENDFNTYAELLFVKPEKIKQLSIDYKIISRKLTFLKQVYRSAGYTGKFPDET